MNIDQPWTSETVQSFISSIVAEVVRTSGTEPPSLSASTAPVDDVEGFDSLASLEAVVLMQEHLGVELPDDLFFSKTGKKTRARSIEEVAGVVLAYISQKGKVYA